MASITSESGGGSDDKEPLIAALLMFRLLYRFLPFVTALLLFGGRGRVEKLACKARPEAAPASHTGELSLSPTIPATISVRQMIRTGSVGSLKITNPTMMLPAAPIPVHTA